MNKSFALIGAAGYIAPRHMKAIADTKSDLVAAFDPSDSVGIIDSYFPNAYFFTEFERFDRYIDRVRREKSSPPIDYISICSPNYLHDSHIRFALRSGADAICEKPLVLNPWNIDGLASMEHDTGQSVHTILQLRLHPSIIDLKRRIDESDSGKKYDVELTYVTSRGRWYLQSWKAQEEKSGGIATNIGVHFYDMLHFIFGNLKENRVFLRDSTKASGFLEYEKARVRWFLSIDPSDLPEKSREKNQRTHRSITVDGDEIEFSGGFTDLHTKSYEEILNGRGFRLEDSRVAIQTVSDIRSLPLHSRSSDTHPFVKVI
ncbi:Gfo/Idh/MocA family oxidoreductase [Thalassococcus sp. BH17M4-6]|uniref:Gfo/Idh/MocA family oxidoreductase n=1 Tax=Thalassococcus sp. BH17M4-6 TaxID=3413148 RepID=UPI003BE1B538